MEVAFCVVSRLSVLSDAAANGTAPRGRPGHRQKCAMSRTSNTDVQPNNIGIRHITIYVPPHKIKRDDIPPHKMSDVLTKILESKMPRLDEELTVLGTDSDLISMVLRTTELFINETGLSWSDIGMVQVGTATNMDRAKPLMSYVAGLFASHGNETLAGADTTFVCNSGVNALCNVINWMSGPCWDGRLGLCIGADYSHTKAVYTSPHDRVWNGAACSAALICKDAPMCLKHVAHRTSHNFTSIRPCSASPYRFMPDIKEFLQHHNKEIRDVLKTVSSWPNNEKGLGKYDFFTFHHGTAGWCRKFFADAVKGEEQAENLVAKLEPSLKYFSKIGHAGSSNLFIYLAGILSEEPRVGSRVLCLGEGSNFQVSALEFEVKHSNYSTTSLASQLSACKPISTFDMLRISDSHIYSYVLGLRSQSPSSEKYRLLKVGDDYKRYYSDFGDAYVPATRNVADGLRMALMCLCGLPLLDVAICLLVIKLEFSNLTWTQTYNHYSALVTLAWRVVALVKPSLLYLELNRAPYGLVHLYSLNLRSFSFFAICACLATLAGVLSPSAASQLWVSYYIFRVCNVLVTLPLTMVIDKMYIVVLHDLIALMTYWVATN